MTTKHFIPRSWRGWLFATCVAVFGLCTAPALAHPHIFVDSRSSVVFDSTGAITAVRHAWTFDEGFTAFAIQGLDTDGDGTYTRDELAELAQVNVESLHEFDFFTFASSDTDDIAFGTPRDYWLVYDGTRLTLHFTLPVEKAFDAKSEPFSFVVYDPSYFVAFDLPAQAPIELAGGDPRCTVSIKRADALDDGMAMMLAQIPASERELPQELARVTETLTNTVTVNCPTT